MSFFPPARPYPSAVYTGTDGEISGWWRRDDAAHDIEYGNGGSCDYLASGATTQGRFGLYRWNMGPGVAGPDPHFHRALAESFFVLAGTIMIHDGTGWQPSQVGDYCYVPEGGIHGFRNESGEPASMLILFAPGAAREQYFEGLAHRAATGERPSDEDLEEFFRAHDTFWV